MSAGAWLPATYANTALAGSAILYVVHGWLHAEPAGQAASALAAAGAAATIAVLGLGAAAGASSVEGLYEGTALLSALAVLAYLAMERAYRNRRAGAAVMAAVMAAVLCEMWLIARGLAGAGAPARGLGEYWEAAHRFAFFLGYCALAAAALCAAFAQARRAPGGFAGATLAWLSVGAPLLALATGMGAVWIAVDRPLVRDAAPIALAALAMALSAGAWARARAPAEAQPGRDIAAAFAAASAALAACVGTTPF